MDAALARVSERLGYVKREYVAKAEHFSISSKNLFIAKP
jgi:hypothetical protein